MKKSYLKLFINQAFIFGLLILFHSCVPSVSKTDSDSASCGTGQSFDSKSRSCVGTALVDGAPVPTASSFSVVEDTTTSATLTYLDGGGDLAESCDAFSASSGLVKSLNHEGLLVTSNSDEEDPQNIYIDIVNDTSLSVSVNDTGTNIFITINAILGTNTTSALSGALTGDGDDDCGDGDASCHVLASITTYNTVNNALSSSALNDISCSCTAGVCSASLIPVDDFNGSSDFYYRLSDSDGSSAYKLAQVSVSAVNDAPNIVVTTGVLSVTEDVASVGDLDTDAGFSVNDTGDGDASGSTLTYEVVTAPAGTLTLNSDGSYSYQTATDSTAADSFAFRVCDPDLYCSDSQTITVSVSSATDAPYGTLTTLTSFSEDGQANDPTDDMVTLTYVEPDGGETITGCDITSTTGVYVSTDCSCTSNVCTVGITGSGNISGTGSFDYTITSSTAPTTSTDQTVSFTLNAVADDPFAFGTASSATSYEDNVGTTAIDSVGNITFNESADHLPNYVDFTVNTGYDPDGDTSLTYSIVTAPANGTLTACMDASGSAGTSDLTCTYTPSSGNLNNSATLADSTTYKGFITVGADIRFVSNRYGDSSSNINIQLIDGDGVGGGREEAWVDGNTVKIIYEGGVSTATDIETAVETNGNARVISMIRVDALTGSAIGSGVAGTYTLSAGTATADSFVYRIQDSTSAYSENRTFHISIQPVDDKPIICEYSSYADTTACGLNGCIGAVAPDSITPDVDGLVYYDTNAAACYQSASSAWTPVSSYIKDRTVNELQTIAIDKIKVDEGGGDSGEDSQQLSITAVTSSNAVLIPTGNIKVIYSGTTTCDTSADNCNGASVPITFGDLTTSEDSGDFTLNITPASGQIGSSTIEITFSDGTSTTEVEFTITVNGNSVTHGGWESIGATGPKVDRNGLVTEDRNTCPFSRDLCESGQACYSTSASPLSNSDADPDSVEAIYLYDDGTTQTCFRMARVAIQDIAYTAKTSSYVSIAYTDGVTAGSETVATTGTGTSGDPYIITVTMEDGVSTTDQIITAIEADSTANALVKAVNTSTGNDQDDQSTTSVGNLSNASWESFTTTCSISHTDTESACSTYGETCLSKGAPSITPTIIDARYYDEEGDVCYRSIGTSASTDWIPYDAVAEINLTWNQFTVAGSDSISEYRVYRRLAGESFDYDNPINIDTISGSTDTYSFSDNATESYSPPIPNTVYFYDIRPVVSSVVTATAEVFNEVRVVAPPKNMSFVHRWMANKAVGDIMNKTTDPNNDYRCEYVGPGDTTVSSTQYYDITNDFLVDRYEAGCAYSAAPTCTGTSDGSCLGIDDPTTEGASASDGAVYYARGEGKCYIRVSSAWQQITTSTQIDNYLGAVDNLALDSTDAQFDETTDKYYNRSNLPPLVNVTQEDAHYFCGTLRDVDNTEFHGVKADLEYKLPSRKEQIAFSQWDRAGISASLTSGTVDSNIDNIETGLSLSSNSYCNSSSANGLSSNYSDVSVPSSTYFYTLPGTDTSGIRSLVTGSSETSSCSSLFGVQDAVGNVAEWTVDRIICDTMSTCSVSTGAQKLTDSVLGDTISSDATEATIYDRWALDGSKGPCVDEIGGDGICDASIGSWAIDTTPFDAGRFFVPVGLVAHTDFLSNNSTSIADMQQIGLTVSDDILHNDDIAVNSIYHFAGTNHCGGLAYGGGYDDEGSGAGVWSMEFIPCDSDGYGAKTIQDITYRSLSTTPQLINIVYAASTGAISISVSTNDITVNLGNSVTPTATVVAAAINADGSSNALVEAVVTGDSTAEQTVFSTQNYLDSFADTAKNARPDVGFRCLLPITPATHYDE